MWTAEEAKKIVGGKLIAGGGRVRAHRISTDSRSLKPGEAFIPLRGKNFDGHAFIRQAVEKGAAWVLKERSARSKDWPERATVIEVEDTLIALGQLAAAWRERFNVKLVGITGSVGKSTTKEMVAQILSGEGKTLKNEGNLNNRVGVPHTLFQLKSSHEYAVLEMGCNEPGEIGKLTQMADPEVGIITRVAPVHLEGLGSLPGVARAKAEMIQALRPEAKFILNLDDPWIGKYAKKFRGTMLGFSSQPEAKFGGESLHLLSVDKEVVAGRPQVRFWVQRKVRGKKAGSPMEFYLWTLSPHNAMNAVAALTVALALGVPLERAGQSLRGFRGLAGRGEVLRSRRGVFIMNDCYNANPLAVAHALETLNWWRGPRRGVAVLGEMMELGRFAEKYHAEVGAKAAQAGLSFLVAQGPHAKIMVQAAVKAGLSQNQVLVVKDHQAAIKALQEHLRAGDWVLVKGSRAMGLETVVRALAK